MSTPSPPGLSLRSDKYFNDHTHDSFNYNVAVSVSSEYDHSAVYRSICSPDRLLDSIPPAVAAIGGYGGNNPLAPSGYVGDAQGPDGLRKYPVLKTGIQTFWDSFEHSLAWCPSSPFLGHRRYVADGKKADGEDTNSALTGILGNLAMLSTNRAKKIGGPQRSQPKINAAESIANHTVAARSGHFADEYAYISYRDAYNMIIAVGVALQKSNLVSVRSFDDEEYGPASTIRPLGICGRNRYQWLITDLMSQRFGYVSVPVYETLGEPAMLHMLRQTKLSTVFGSEDSILNLLKLVAAHVNDEDSDPIMVQTIVLFDTLPSDHVSFDGLDVPAKVETLDSIMNYAKKLHLQVTSLNRLWACGLKILKGDTVKDKDFVIHSITHRRPSEYVKIQEPVADKVVSVKKPFVGTDEGEINGVSSLQSDKSLVSSAHFSTINEAVLNDVPTPSFKGIVLPPRPHKEDLMTICYTSGTTGIPKGALLTHGGFGACATGAWCGPLNAQGLDLGGDTCYYSYLPLAHVLERALVLLIISIGGSLSFSRGHSSHIMEDIKFAKPTLFVTVPRILVKLYDSTLAKANNGGPVVRTLFTKALNDKLANLRKDGTLTHPVWDRTVFAKLKEALGGRVRYIIYGGAGMATEIQEELICMIGCPILSGYGMTESTGCLFTRPPVDYSAVSSGMIHPCNEFKLVSVPDMGYLAGREYEDYCQKLKAEAAGVGQTSVGQSIEAKYESGEIWVRGKSIFKGYFRNAIATREAITPDGWLKTGDIVSRLSANRIAVVDRKKDLFKLQQGEYISPAKLENIAQQSPYLNQIFIWGDSTRRYVIAIGVVEPSEVLTWYSREGARLIATEEGETEVTEAVNDGQTTPLRSSRKVSIPERTVSEILSTPFLVEALKKDVLASITSLNKMYVLMSFERVRNIHLVMEPFTVENKMLTPSMKLVRAQIKARYSEIIEDLYDDM